MFSMARCMRSSLSLALICCLLVGQISFGDAGPAYTVCYFTCMAACCSASGGVGAALCAASCAASCTATLVACFADDTVALVLDNDGKAKTVPVQTLQPGQLVETLLEGRHIFTKVLRNVRSGGSFSFIEILAVNGQQRFNLTVTEHHNLPRSSTQTAEGLEVALASELLVGDFLPVASHGASGYARIVSVRQVQQSFKNTLVTESGTVLSNSILATTICDGEEQIYDRSNLTRTLHQWHSLHADLIFQ